jgi:hypothetical protein
MSGLTHLSEREVEVLIKQINCGYGVDHIAATLSDDQAKELHVLMWFGQSDNANLGFAWHHNRYQTPLHRPINLCAASLRRGLFRLRAETKLVYSAA